MKDKEMIDKAQNDIEQESFDYFGGNQDVSLWNPDEYAEKCRAILTDLIASVREQEQQKRDTLQGAFVEWMDKSQGHRLRRDSIIMADALNQFFAGRAS